MSLNPVQISFQAFGEVAKLAAIQELKLRLLANKTQVIADSAYEFHIHETSKKVVEHFKGLGKLTEIQANLLLKSQSIRNKILHCEFNAAVKKINELVGKKAAGPSVKILTVAPDATGEQLLEQIFAAQECLADGLPGNVKDASELKDHEVGIFGGLINCVQTGAMEMAFKVFEDSNALLDELMMAEIASETSIVKVSED